VTFIQMWREDTKKKRNPVEFQRWSFGGGIKTTVKTVTDGPVLYLRSHRNWVSALELWAVMDTGHGLFKSSLLYSVNLVQKAQMNFNLLTMTGWGQQVVPHYI